MLAWYAMVETNSIKIQKEALNAAYSRDQIEHVSSLIFSILEGEKNCLTTLASNGIGSLEPQTNYNISSINLAGASLPAFEANSNIRYINNQVAIDQISLRTPADLNDPSVLQIVFSRYNETKKGLGGSTIRKNMRIEIRRSDATTPSSCKSVPPEITGTFGTVGYQKEVCEELGIMDWNEETKECKFKDMTCEDNFLFLGLDADGNKICRHFDDFFPTVIDSNFSYSCPDDYDTIKFARQLSGLIFVECNKSNETCPSVYNMKWTEGIHTCKAFLPRGLNGERITLEEKSPDIGEATYLCQNGTWIYENSTGCIEFDKLYPDGSP